MAALGLTIEKPFKKEHTWFCGGSYIGRQKYGVTLKKWGAVVDRI